jgi:hypothetical protein
VSHPFHPRFGQEFRLVSLRRLRDEPLLLVADDQEECLWLPLLWTDAAPPDVFVELAEGRCPFRIDDLVALADLLDGLRQPRPERKGDYAADVK